MKKIWIFALIAALTFAFAGCNDEGYPPIVQLPVGAVVLELADIIGSAAADDVLTLSAPYAKSDNAVTLTVGADGKSVVVSTRGADYHGIDVDVAGLDHINYEYEIDFAGFTTGKGTTTDVTPDAAVKIGQAASPYTDLFALVTVALDTPVSGTKDLAPVFGPKGQNRMRISANEVPYVNGGHKEDFTITKFVVKVKTVL